MLTGSRFQGGRDGTDIRGGDTCGLRACSERLIVGAIRAEGAMSMTVIVRATDVSVQPACGIAASSCSYPHVAVSALSACVSPHAAGCCAQ